MSIKANDYISYETISNTGIYSVSEDSNGNVFINGLKGDTEGIIQVINHYDGYCTKLSIN